MNRKNVWKFILVFGILAILQNNETIVFAQVSQEDLDAIKREKEYAENQAAIAKAKREKMDALFPKPDASSLVGGTTVNEGTFIETQMLGYCAMINAAGKVRERIKNLQKNAAPLPTSMVVYNEEDVQRLSRYTIMLNHLKNLELSYTTEADAYIAAIQTVKPGFSKAAARALVASPGSNRSGFLPAIDIALKALTLFKTDIELTPADVAIGEDEFVAEVFNGLPGYALYYPKTIPLSIQDCTAVAPASCSPLLDQIKKTTNENSLVTYLVEVEVKRILDDRDELIRLNALIANPATPAAQLPGLNNDRNAILVRYPVATPETALLAVKAITDPIKARVNKIDALFEGAMDDLGVKTPNDSGNEGASTVSEDTADTPDCPGSGCQQTTVNVSVGDKKDEKGGGGGDSSFGSYLQAEKLKEIMSAPNSYWIDLNVIKAGGNMRVKSNIITNFLFGSRVNFSGGAITYFNVFNRSGASVKSGVVQIYENYRKSSRINDKCNSVN